jgi:hypothetical protein
VPSRNLRFFKRLFKTFKDIISFYRIASWKRVTDVEAVNNITRIDFCESATLKGDGLRLKKKKIGIYSYNFQKVLEGLTLEAA